MHPKTLPFLLFTCLALLSACGTSATPAPGTVPPLVEAILTTPAPTETLTPLPPTIPPSDTPTPLPSETATSSPVPVNESLDAVVTVDRLSCRYGPGSEYLYLYALVKGAKIQLIGQTGGNNWAWVDGENKCWVNIKFIEIAGDFKTLPIVYPEPAKLPRTPYYPPTSVLSATRNGNTVSVSWLAVPISPGDYEDESMFNYIVEVWRCEAGQMIFDPLATNSTTISFTDEPGCTQPSHGRIFVQEKHGFAGPAEIPWP